MSRAGTAASGHAVGGALGSAPNATPRRGSTADAVTDALREAILDGRLPASKWLREQDLAEELAVSRTPVREAMRRLVVEGLAIRVPNQGTRVAPMAMEDVLAVYAVRESLEGLAARLAAQRSNARIADVLRAVHAELLAAADGGDVAEFARQNLLFHRAMREATGNAYLERFLTLVEHSVRRFGATTFEDRGRMRATIGEHQAIIDAIVAGRPEEAEQHALAHMRQARDARLAAFLRANT